MISDSVKKIRDLINSPIKQYQLLSNATIWNRLCSSMDTIEDCEMAIDHFNSLPLFDGLTGGYLYIHGLLQTLYMQQDSIDHLSQSLFCQRLDYKKNYPEIYNVRDLRNDVTGHPTNRNGGKYFCVISQTTINNLGFTYCRYLSDGKIQFINVEIKPLLNKQRELVQNILNKIIGELEMEDKEHKKKFAEKKLISIFPNTLNYHISKLYEGIHSPDVRSKPLVEMNLGYLQEIADELKKAIEDRYNNLKSLPVVNDTLLKIEYIINHLNELYNSQKYSKNLDTEIYLDSLKMEINELKDMCKEIDEEFKV